jgi:hypothetical protein
VDILQIAPAKIRFTQGFEQVRITRLSPKGLLRSWAGCCRTPIGNLLARPRVPFIGVAVPFVVPEARAALPASSGGIHGRLAIGGCPPGVHPSAPVGLLARTGWRMLGRALRGEHRPSPFFGVDGQLTVAPEVLALEVRAALYG